MANTYIFVHTPKCGGLSMRKFSKDSPIKGFDKIHRLTCKNGVNPIIIVRDPIDRFISLYRFWKNGSSDVFKKKYASKHTVKEFIDCMKAKRMKSLVQTGGTMRCHFQTQTCWIQSDTYARAIVIRYQKDLGPSITKLFEYLGMPLPSEEYPRVNESIRGSESVDLDEVDIAWIHEYYAADFVLWDLVNNHPEQFRKVI